MTLTQIKHLWTRVIAEILNSEFQEPIIDCLSRQMIDSIRRVLIFRTYLERAEKAEIENLPYFHTSNPFTLAQRSSLSLDSRIWHNYVATYFGKSNKSKWMLFNRATFREDKSLITFEDILDNPEEYFEYLRSISFFDNSSYSNHRKYTKKSLEGDKGVFLSFYYVMENIHLFKAETVSAFDVIYRNSLSIPNFGRMAAFDFSCNLCKCGLNVLEPESMYQRYSTGPLSALRNLLTLADVPNPDKNFQVSFGDDLLTWFDDNSNIYMLAQVLEDTICNWQKSPLNHIRYFG